MRLVYKTRNEEFAMKEIKKLTSELIDIAESRGGAI